MTSPITFTPIASPIANDDADGATAFNMVAAGFDNNFAKIPAWASAASSGLEPGYAPSGVVAGFKAWTVWDEPNWKTYGRKWGPLVFVTMALYNTGPAIPPGSDGDLGATIGTMYPAWYPPYDVYVGGVFHSYGPCTVLIGANGVVSLKQLSQGGVTFPSNRAVLVSASWVGSTYVPGWQE